LFWFVNFSRSLSLVGGTSPHFVNENFYLAVVTSGSVSF
jgi:hypothetical protein